MRIYQCFTYFFGVQIWTIHLYGYNSVYKLPKDFDKQIILHNLFTVLAHSVLFGCSYLSQFRSMIKSLI
ncbi:MAG: fructosamine kinase family protein [Methanobrevibacter sp.]|nr:fructosamine kinase family protein [Methanobrevibacter sp.]